jgi:hypothetical protein
MAPPMVLPTVATNTAGQNSAGFSLTRPNTAGSDPSGSSVADTSDTMNTVLRPTSAGPAAASSEPSRASIQDSIGRRS